MAKPQLDLGGGLSAAVDRASVTTVTLHGHMTEKANLTPLTQLGTPVRFDLSGVDHINSLGVRGWMQFIKKCETAGVAMQFDRVSAVMVQQMSMISGFMGTRSHIASLFAPYACDNCGNMQTELIAVTPGAALSVRPSMPCTKCGQTALLDESPTMYTSLPLPKSA